MAIDFTNPTTKGQIERLAKDIVTNGDDHLFRNINNECPTDSNEDKAALHRAVWAKALEDATHKGSPIAANVFDPHPKAQQEPEASKV